MNNATWIEADPQDGAPPEPVEGAKIKAVFKAVFFMTAEEKAPLYRRCCHENLIVYCQLCESEAAKAAKEART